MQSSAIWNETETETEESLLNEIHYYENTLIDERIKNFTLNQRVKLQSTFSSRPNYSPDGYLEKIILSILQATNEIQKQSQKKYKSDPETYILQLKDLRSFLRETICCIDDIIGFEKNERESPPLLEQYYSNEHDKETVVCDRVQLYLIETKTYRNIPANAWRQLTKPVINLCKALNSSFKSGLESVGLFSKRRKTDQSDRADLTDKANKLAHTLRNTT